MEFATPALQHLHVWTAPEDRPGGLLQRARSLLRSFRQKKNSTMPKTSAPALTEWCLLRGRVGL